MGAFFAVFFAGWTCGTYSLGVVLTYIVERSEYGTDPLPALKMALVWPWHALTGRKG